MNRASAKNNIHNANNSHHTNNINVPMLLNFR